MRDDACGGINRRGGGCTENTRGAEDGQRSTEGMDRYWDGNLEITARDVHLDRKLIDGRSRGERTRTRVHGEGESGRNKRVEAQRCQSGL